MSIESLFDCNSTTVPPKYLGCRAKSTSMLSRGPNELLRRGPWTCLTCSSLGRTPAALTTAHQRLSGSKHERKHSSSKASSSSKEDSRSIAAATEPAGKAVPKDGKASTPDVPTGSEKRSGLRSSKRRSKANARDASIKPDFARQMNLPSVPSTQNLHPLNVHLASFFSTHRPLSITSAIPPSTSTAAFSSLFEAKPPSNSPRSDVIYTLASAVDRLENPTPFRQQQDILGEVDLQTAVTQASTSNTQAPDDVKLTGKTVHINVQDLAGQFKPYTPPPPPTPLGALEEAAGISSETKAKQATRPVERKSFKTTLTIYQSTHPNGERFYETHSSPIVVVPTSSDNAKHFPSASSSGLPFLTRMRERRIQYEDRIDERLGGEIWQLISVKRQRKLKMKKHKYKKLMKKTKNLRRRLGRI